MTGGKRRNKRAVVVDLVVLGLAAVAVAVVIGVLQTARGWFVCLVVGAAGAWLAWHRQTTRKALRRDLEHHTHQVALATDIGCLLSITPYEFEYVVGEVLEGVGYTDVQVTKGSGDHGVDIDAVDPWGRRCIVQCKQYAPARPVGGPAVRDLIGTSNLQAGARPILVTTAGFTRDAISNARQGGVELIDGTTLVSLARQALAGAAAQLRDGQSAAPTTASTCPACGQVVAGEVAFCSHCGTPIVRVAEPARLGNLMPAATPAPTRPTAGPLDTVLGAAAAVLLVVGGVGTALALGRTSGTSGAAQDGLTGTSSAATPSSPTYSAPADTPSPTVTTSRPAPAPRHSTVTPPPPEVPTPVTDMDFSVVESKPHVADVVWVFDTYFDGINSHDGALAASVFAPGGVHDPNDPADIATLEESTSSTYDSQIVIDSIEPATVNSRKGLHVSVRFVSEQSPKQGYQGQTCSRWKIMYALAPMAGSHKYGLFGSVGPVIPRPC